MNPLKLLELELTAFRGATKPARIPFDSSRKLTMVFGENGAGKSSIVDGFSFLCEGKFGSLEDRSGTGNDYIAAITADKASLRVKLTTSKGICEATLKGKSVIEAKPLENKPSARILRRAQILQLIEQKPVDRYKALGQYIELPGVIKAEAALREAEKEKKSDYDQAVKACEQAGSALEALWTEEGKPGVSAAAWAVAEKAIELTQMAADLEVCKGITDAISTVENRRNDYVAAAGKQKGDADTATKCDDALKAEEAQAVGQNSSLLDLLQKAKGFVAGDTKAGDCPVCQKSVDRNVLVSELTARIAAMNTLATLASAAESARGVAARSSTVADSAKSKYATGLKDCASLLDGSAFAQIEGFALDPAAIQKLVGDGTTTDQIVTDGEVVVADFSTLKTKLTTLAADWQKRVHQHSSIKLQHDTLVTKTNESETLAEISRRTKQALTLVVESRKSYVESELASISTEVERLYRAIHPGEKLGEISLGLDPKTQGSLHLKGNFYSEKDVAPQSLFSEGHLDTLGFCVFFALAKKYRDEQTLVLLDDVVTSVDDPHLERFIQLLHDEAPSFAHIIITTHYRPWRDRYRHQRAPVNELHFVDLKPWSLENGIRIHKERAAIAELRDALAAQDFNRRDVANQAGILIENILDYLTLLYGCKLSRKSDPKYTLGELLNGFGSELLKVAKIEIGTVIETVEANKKKTRTFTSTGTTDLKPFVEQFRSLACVRNQVGCHYNYDGASVSDKDIEDFGKAALAFAEAMTCPDAGDLPSRKPSGSFWETRSGRIRLFPLETPPKN